MSARKVAIVTGAASGIGAATAIEFARRGYDVSITDIALLTETAEQARSLGARVDSISGDLADMSFVSRLADRIATSLGRIDVLVNNAAWRELLTMRQISLESWEKTLRICLTAPAFLAKGVATHMEKQKSGVIVNVSSIMSNHATGIAPAYIAAKGALDALTYDLAALYGRSGIRVIAVNPGAVDTALGHDYTPASDQSGFERRLRDWSHQMIPLGRWAAPQEVARAIVAMCGDEASYLSGTTVTLDGGWSHQLWPYALKHEQNPDEFP